ncbi:Rdx family protein [Streptomyces sp. NPDC001093]|uniref:Rdx family protein n=1 Tax=Streptomyces sp. NPDC001093 TaxID=3154376 RepID=UPI00332758B5
MSHRARIEYCTRCRRLPRAAWPAREPRTTLVKRLVRDRVAPGKPLGHSDRTA